MKYFCPDKNWELNSRITTRSGNKWFNYIEGYKMITELVEKEIKQDRSNQDFLIFPYCNCIRHYIEISLKEIIENGNKQIEKDINSIQYGHSLSLSLKELEKVLSILDKQEFNIPQDVEDFIDELQGIDVNSDGFRYPTNRQGNATLENLDSINFQKVADGFLKVKSFLESISSLIANIP
jgi:hypothetical protein